MKKQLGCENYQEISAESEKVNKKSILEVSYAKPMIFHKDALDSAYNLTDSAGPR